MKKTLIAFIALALLTAVVVLALYTGYLRFNYPSYSDFPVQGIDISHYQGEAVWSKVNRREVGFVFVKATEGVSFKDELFQYNWSEAKKYGIPVGAYHFFSFCKSGNKQADNFINSVPNGANQLPPVIDLEFDSNCNTSNNTQELLSRIDTLQQRLFENYGKRPILYVTQEFYEQCLLGKFKENPIWFRDIYKEPTIADKREWQFWQYGNRGRLAGIKTYVDLNAFHGSKAEFDKLLE